MGARDDKAIAVWLGAVCLCIAAMVVLGGLTRLTHSGLSITEWRPVTGWLPPLSASDWNAEFARYQESPEFQKVNSGMNVEQFKGIFWLEYVHRLVGRLTGLVFLVPFVWFIVRRRLNARQIAIFAGILALGGMQGVIGWYMVKSGLVDRPAVSHYRLTVHLGMAFAVYGLTFWQLLLHAGLQRRPQPLVARLGGTLLALSALQIVYGALVAGLHAGLFFNTFPLMNGHLVPPLMAQSPWYLNFVENPVAVQFVHRLLAFALALIAVVLVIVARTADRVLHQAAIAALAIMAVQFGLGVATLLFRVPVGLGVAHQFGALLLVTALLSLLFLARPGTEVA